MNFRDIIAAPGPGAIGGWCRVPSPMTVELMAQSGVDWVCIDLQHGAGGEHDLASLLPVIDACDVSTFVRVRWNEPHSIMRALDAGAEGVIVPMVNSPEDARRAASAAHYAPTGYRSWGPLRRRRGGSPPTPALANEAVVCLVMIESADAVRCLDEILDVEGIDGVYIGPSDLAISNGGTAGDLNGVEAMIEEIRLSCERAGVLVGIHTPNAQVARRRLDAGFQAVAIANDTTLLRNAAAAAVTALRSPDAKEVVQ